MRGTTTTFIALVLLSTLAILLRVHAELPHFGKPELMFRGLSNMSVGIHSVEAGAKGEIIVLFNVEFSDKSRNLFTRTLFANETWSRIEWVVPHETQQIESSGALKILHDSSKQFIVSTTRALDKQRNTQRVLFRERYQRRAWEGGHHISNSSVLASNFELDQRGNIHAVWLDSAAKNCTRAFYRRRRFNAKHSKEESFEKPILVSNAEFCRANARVHPFIHLLKQDTLVYMWVDQLNDAPSQLGHRLVYATSKSFAAKTKVQWLAPQVAFSARNITSLITASCNERASIISIWKGAVKGFMSVSNSKTSSLPSFITFFHNDTWSEHIPSSILGNVATVASKLGGYWIMHDTSMDNDAQLLIERRLETNPGRSLDKTVVVPEKRKRSHLSLVESPARRLFAFWVEQGRSGDNMIHEIKYSFAKL